MDVYCVRGPEGWLYRGDALMVYLSSTEAEADGPEPDAEVVDVKAEAITRRLERGEVGRVRLVLKAGEHYLVGLDQWRELAAAAEERIRAEAEAQARRFLMVGVARGDLEYDPQTGEYRRIR